MDERSFTVTVPTRGKKLYKLIGLIALLVFTIHLVRNGGSLFREESALARKKRLNYYIKDKSPHIMNPEQIKYNKKYAYSKFKKNKYKGKKVKATFVTLARNSDLYGLLPSVKSVEDRFNSKFQYDWVFLNDVEFSAQFKKAMTAMISGNVKFGVIPKEHWSIPSWIDEDKAAAARKSMGERKIIYGDSLPYRHMCRFESGFFWRHPLMDEYDYYWRVEPDTKMYCDIDYDVFKFMHDNDKKYGFTISIHEYGATIETLWDKTRDFMSLHPEHLAKDNMLNFISDDNGESYNMCHFWSNFEIASLNLWRGAAYREYFDYLDHAGGFFYERWGDAPVHSIAASLFLDRNQIHHFNDLGYYHGPFHQCPIDESIRLANRCACNPSDDFTWKGYSCGNKFYEANKLKKPDNWELFK